MATEVIYHIGVGHERPGYDTIKDWVLGTQINCVSSGVIIVGQLSHGSGTIYDEDVILIGGATVDVDNYRMVRPAASSIGDGTSGTGPVIYSDIGSFGAVVNVNENFFRLDNVDVASDGIGVMYGIFQNAANTDLLISGVNVMDCHYCGVLIQNSGQIHNSNVLYCGAYDLSVGGIHGNSSSVDDVMAVHCTILRDDTDSNRSVTGFRYLTVKNTLAFHYGGSAGHGDYLNLGTESTRYGSSDTTGETTELQSLTLTDEVTTAASGTGTDLRLLETASVIGSGVPLISEDIEREARDLTEPDLGSDEFTPASVGVSESDTNDTQKDNIGAINPQANTLVVSSWNISELANPSGSRHATSGWHPGFSKVLGLGSTSGLDFGEINQNTSSGVKAIIFRSSTSGATMSNMKVWMSDASAFAGVTGYEATIHIDSEWIPNLVLPSGSGIVGNSYINASGVLRSDLTTTILGNTVDGDDPSSPEPEVSQYIYLGFDTNGDFTGGTYGPTGFEYRITIDDA